MSNNLFLSIATTAKSAFSTVKFETVKHSPEILLGVGVVGLLGAGVLACRATLKAKDTVEDYKYSKEEIESTIRTYVGDELVDYTDEDKAKDLSKVKMKTGLELTKEFAPVAAVTIVSIAALVTSHNILRKRALALAAAYAALDTSFKNYRNNVIDRYGEEVDKELRYGVKKELVDKTTVDAKGKEKTEKVEQTTIDGNVDEYTRVFDSSNKYWDSNETYVRQFLDSEESRANNLLRINKHVFLNEIFERLGFEKTKIGQVVGWTYSEDEDCYIDFGIYLSEGADKAFLKFNPQGYILDKLEVSK